MKRFINDLKKYFNYAKYAAKSDLKSEVAGSYLSWLWWILDPLLFMLVYTFISLIVFKQGEQYFPIYVFIGLTTWNFFNRSIMSSVRLVKTNTAIVSKVYLPKFILIMQVMMNNGFKMLISFVLVVIMMFIYQVPISWKVLFAIPYVMNLMLITFGLSAIVLHFGVFVNDLSNVLNVLLKLIFYMSGIFYSIEGKVPSPFNEWLLQLNPAAFLISDLRQVLLYNKMPLLHVFGAWVIVGCILCFIGVKIIYKNENSYVKVM